MSRRRAQLLPVSALTPEAIPDLAAAYAEIVSDRRRSLGDVCFSAGTARTHHPWRVAVVGRLGSQMAERLRRAPVPARAARSPGSVAFVFSGTGQERALMGRRLLDEEPVFVRALMRCEVALAPHVDWSLVEEISAPAARSRMDAPELGQPALWALQVSLAALWRSWGIEPGAVIGHSMGELSACTVAGALSLEDAAKVIVERSRLAAALAGQGTSAAVTADAAVVAAALAAGDGLVSIAAENGPGQTVVSGEPEALRRVLERLAAQGVSGRVLPIPYAVHSEQLREHAGAHAEALAGIEPLRPQLPVASTLTGRIETEAVFDAGYWAANVSEPVRFGPALRRLADEGHTAFLELGAHPVLGGAISRTLNAHGADAAVLYSLSHDRDDREALLTSLASLYTAGADVNWAALHGRGAQRVELPRYRWQRERHWLDAPAGPAAAGPDAAPPDQVLDGVELADVAEHVVVGRAVMPAAGYMVAMAAATRRAFGPGRHTVRGLAIHEALAVDPGQEPALELHVEGAGDERTCTLTSGDGSTTHGTAELRRGPAGAEAPATEPLRALRERCGRPVDAGTHYARLREAGLDHGERFRLLGEAAAGADEAVAELAPGGAVARLDAAIQLVAALLPAGAGGAPEPMLPAGAERVHVPAELGGPAFAHVRLRAGGGGPEEGGEGGPEEGGEGGPELRADVVVADPEGKVLAEILGLRLRRLAARAGRGALLHELDWVPMAGPDRAASAPADVVVVGAPEDVAPVAGAVWAAGHRCRAATDPVTAAIRGATHAVLVAPGALVRDGAVSAAGAAAGEERGALLLRALVRRLLEAGGEERPRLITVTGGLRGAAVLGMARTVPLEHPELRCRRIDVRDGGALPFELAAALLADDGADELALGAAGRLRPELRRMAPGPAAVLAAVRDDRTYLVTGGLGAVGLRIAAWLADRGAGRIALVGRRAPGADAEQAIGALREGGAEVVTLRADVADPVACAALLDELRGEGPPLGGVVHAAGVLDDAALAAVEPEQIAAVLAPKVRGAWNLHELTAGDPLELFVLMSSIAGVIGAPGQAHYGAANAALDALARRRRAAGQAALAIAWGPWAGRGMAARSADRLRAGGLEPLSAERAIGALDRALASGLGEVLVADADWRRVRAALPGRPPRLLEALAAPAGPAAPTAPAQTGATLGGGLRHAPKALRRDRVTSELRAQLGAVLGTDPATIDPGDAINRLGLDSLMAIELRTGIERSLPVVLPLTRLLDGMTVGELASHLVAQLDEEPRAPDPRPGDDGPIVPAPDELHDPFPLNEIQLAYWMGRRGLFPLGTVSAHIYAEVDARGLDAGRLTVALRHVIDRHPALRTVVNDDGTQQVLASVPPYRPPERDVRGAADREAALAAIRDELSHQVRPADRWPLFEFALTRIDDETTRVHASIDMLIVDAASALMLGDELVELYEGARPRPPLALSFRDYATALARRAHAPQAQASREYWSERLATLPPAPELPLARAPETIAQARFHRRSHDMDAATWSRLRERATAAGLTPSAVLCAAYAEVLAAWSASPRLTLNLTTYRRVPLHPDVGELIGDFTELTLLGVEPDLSQPFERRAQALSRQLVADLEHPDVNGVTLLRELVRTRRMAWASMPVVFTSTLTQTAGRGPLPLERLGEVAHLVTQTPQVWIDFQAIEREGVLSLSWDAVDELFPPGLVDDMFAAYRGLVERLAAGEEAWGAADLELVPPAQLTARAAANATEAPIPPSLLHEPLWRWAAATPAAPAVIAADRVLSYGELADLADRWAARLVRGGVRRGELVGIAMRRGWEQPVAAMAVLRAGAAYLPVDPEQPAARQAHLLEAGGVTTILTQSDVAARVPVPAGAELLAVDAGPGAERPAAGELPAVQPEDLAYVIFTSGSTGSPKGVAIQHAAAMNTVLDCNRRWGVTTRDRTFAISSLGFDLSVYDLFGMTAAGGAVVVPDAAHALSPGHWAEAMRAGEVSIWSSVPALMTLLTEHLSARGSRFNPELRTVMLSGDWIPLGLPDAIRELADEVTVIGLGGATEASIWSVFHEVGEVSEEWSSIPYGKPLANQRLHVLDEQLRPRPAWVPGEIHIAGAGLALGYWGDREQTAAAFHEHPRTGERLYRTGDVGRYLPDGSIEFLGRRDGQVKVGGNRVELAEVEAQLERHPAVARAVLAAPGPREERRLVAYVVPVAGRTADPAELRAWLEERLPSYMVPPTYTPIEEVPLGANGKVDRRALAELGTAPPPAPATALSGAERAAAEEIATYVAELLEIDEVGLGDDLIDLGFDSLRLLRLVDRLERRFGVRPEIGDLFRLSTVAAIAAHCERLAASPPAPADPAALLEADAVLDAAIVPSAAARPPRGVPERVLLTGATGFLGAHLLDELVRRTGAEVHCLVRAPSDAAARRRLRRALEGWGLNELADSDRWVALAGDLAAPGLGGGGAAFDRLAATIDAIYHCAGLVNFAYPYERLRAPNVLGTRELLRLSASGGGIPVNHVSTTGVVPHLTLGVAQLVPETGELPPAGELETGYTASKWVAERLVASARDRGLPVRIFRPGLITGHSRTGVCNPRDALWTVLRGVVEAGCAPDVDIPLFAAPVDYVAAAIVRLGLPQADGGDVAHLVAPFALGSRAVCEWLRAAGHPLEYVPYEAWRGRVAEHAHAREDEALGLLVALLPAQLPATRELLVETRNAVAAIEDPELPSPIIDAAHVRRYANHLSATGFWPEPSDLLVGT
ncbi:MAG TPA: amino acid adenylation domain-containing protein [Thermoleophilaceae bacterium]